MKDQIINLVFIFIITASLGAILGLSVLRLIDMKLTDVSINIPPIKIPPSNITLEYPSWTHQSKLIDSMDNAMIGGNSQCKKNKKENDKKKSNNKIKVKNNDISVNVGKNKEISADDIKQNSSDFRSNHKKTGLANYVKTKTKNVDSLKTSNFEDIVYPNKSFLEINDQNYDNSKYHEYTHQFNNQQYHDYEIRNKQYYKDPEDMTMRQLNKFKKYAKFDKMTVNDYTNWLLLFGEHQLSPFNQKNLLKLKKGQKLCESDLPTHKLNPDSSSEYYHEMINELPKLK